MRFLKVVCVAVAVTMFGCAKVESSSEIFSSTPAGLLGSGQIVRIKEDRPALMAAPTWASSSSGMQYKVAGGAPGVIAWKGQSCFDIVRGCAGHTTQGLAFSGITGSGDAEGPAWTNTADSQFQAFSIGGGAVIFPHDAIPDGKWQITAKFSYGIIPRQVDGVMPDFGGLGGHASVDLTCAYTAANGKSRHSPIEGSQASKSYIYDGQSWDRSVIAFVSPPTTLSDCKAKGSDAGLEIQFSIGDAKQAQFYWIEMSMAPVN